MDELRYQVDLLNAMNQKLSNDERMYRIICSTSNSAIIYISLIDGTIKTMGNWDFYFPNTELKDLSGLSKLYSQIEDKYVMPLRNLLFLEQSERPSDSGIFKMKDGKTWVECEANIIYDEHSMPTDKIIRFKNISKLKRQNDELTYMAYYDALTGLYNRNYFVRLLADFVRKAEDTHSVVSVMFIDIDDFRMINDGFGIIIGDEIVQQFGQYLSGFSSDTVLVSHFNADLYCIGIFEPSGTKTPENIFRSINEQLKTPFLLSNGQNIALSVSVGVAEYPEAAQSTLDLINCAEIVMFKAKGTTKSTIQYFDSVILNNFLNRISIENKLKQAVLEKNFLLYYQPQFFVDNKKLRGMEVLIRWRDFDGQIISPNQFIPIAEKNGSIVSIGNWVIDMALKTYSKWNKQYGSDVIVSINISAIQYRKEDFVDTIISCIRKYDLNPENIELEITESVFIENFTEVTERLEILREYGIHVSLDDFGTGYSSLSYLKGLPIDTLKIDKSFIDSITTDENTRVITESIVYLAKKLGFETIAEGVEEQCQFEYLQNIGCECIQGFLLSKPLSEEDMEKILLKLSYEL